MENRTVKVGIRHDMMDKAGDQHKKRTGRGWENKQLTVKQLMTHIGNGFPITHHFAGGHRKTENFLGAEILIADIDKGLTLEEAKIHPFVMSYASFLHTTASHTETNPRLRIIFVLDRVVVDSNYHKALYSALMLEIPTDASTKSCASFFFGNRQAIFHWIGRSLPEDQIDKMIRKGLEDKNSSLATNVPARLTNNPNVHVKNRGLQPIDSLPYGTSIHCPFGTHVDKKPSAFIKVNADGVRGVECRSCKVTAWNEHSPYSDGGNGHFHNKVLEYAGQSSKPSVISEHARLFPEIETSLANSNYHVSSSSQFSLGADAPGINLIKSAKGTGKTYTLSKLVERFKSEKFKKLHGLENKKVILIGHRQALIRESATKLGMECYLNTGEIDTQPKLAGMPPNGGLTQKPQYYAICLDSLHSRVKLYTERYGIVIIDESEQVFSHFLSNQMEHPTRNFDVLSSLIKNAKFVYCLDADLNTITLAGVIACLSYDKDQRERQDIADVLHHQKFYSHLNIYLPPTRQLYLYDSKYHLIDELRKDINSSKKCYVTSNNKKFVQEQYEAFRRRHPDKKFILIVSGIGNDEENRFFLKNITSEILNYDAVFSSPTIGTGIDITFPNNATKIDCVYGFFDGGINTHFDMDQQLGRVRHPGEVKVWVSPARSRFSTDRPTVLRELLFGKNKIKGLNYYLEHNGVHAASGDHPILDLLTEIRVVRRNSMNNVRRNFINHKNANGWKVEEVSRIDGARRNGSIVGKAGRLLRKKDMIDRIITAPDISFREAKLLEEDKDKGKPQTDVQKASLRRYWLKAFYCQDVTKDLILLDNDGKTQHAIQLLELVIDPNLKFQNYQQIIEDAGLVAQFNPNVDMQLIKAAVYVREGFALAGIYDPQKNCLLPQATYGSATLLNFARHMHANPERLAQLFEKELNGHLFTRPARQVGSILRLVCLKQELVKANKGGNKGGATYRIEPLQYELIMDIIRRRAKKKSDKLKLKNPLK